MPIVEIVTSCLLTYSSTEYLYGTKRRALHAAWVVIGLQLLEAFISLKFSWRLSLPANLWPLKVVLVAGTFIATLWLDCARVRRPEPRAFAAELGRAMLVLLPVFPWVTVLLSFGFLVLGSALEFAGLPTRVLNGPIYYGTLYGPFSIVYHQVKKRQAYSPLLPSISSAGNGETSAPPEFRIIREMLPGL